MTAPRPDRRLDPTHSSTSSPADSLPAVPSMPLLSLARTRNESAPLTRRDNPDTPPAPLRRRRPPEHQPRTYTTPEFAPRRRNSRADEEPTLEKPTLDELDRWDEEWRGEWDRGDVDDSAAYDEEVDVAEQTRDVEWLLDALDALDDTSDGDAFDWDE
jgi:hypothetical protein